MLYINHAYFHLVNTLGMCKPSDGIIAIYVPHKHYLPRFNKDYANKRIDYYDEETEKLLQQRWYNADGYAQWDLDWEHGDGDHSHIFPHDHFFNWSTEPYRFDYLGPNGEVINVAYN